MERTVLAPFYISVAWVLMISYQLSTQTAVIAIVDVVNVFWPSTISSWLASKIDILVFIHGFAWVFLLSSAIPSVILGKTKSVIIQFIMCLTLTLTSFWIKDFLPIFIANQASNGIEFWNALELSVIPRLMELFYNPLFASIYLSAPYIFMLIIDLKARTKNEDDF